MTSVLNRRARRIELCDRAQQHPAIVEWNAANDPFADFRRQLDSGKRVIVLKFVGLLMSDMDEYERLMERAIFEEGYQIQRHSEEKQGHEGSTPMLVKRDAR